MNGFRSFQWSDDTAFVAMTFIGFVVGGVLLFFYNRSFEPAQFLVVSKQWVSTTELVHDETDSEYVCNRNGDCSWETDTDTVVDARVILSGQGLDPIAYHSSFVPKGSQYIRHGLATNVQLDYAGTAITYKPDQSVYERLPLGGYCLGEIGWFKVVRNMRCGGR